MNRRGLMLLDVIMCLFVIGLIVVITFPTLGLISKSFEKSKEMTDMTYLLETSMEKLRSGDEEALKFLENLNKKGGTESTYLEEENYISKISITDIHPDLWKLIIRIYKINGKGENGYVEIKATIPK